MDYPLLLPRSTECIASKTLTQVFVNEGGQLTTNPNGCEPTSAAVTSAALGRSGELAFTGSEPGAAALAALLLAAGTGAADVSPALSISLRRHDVRLRVHDRPSVEGMQRVQPQRVAGDHQEAQQGKGHRLAWRRSRTGAAGRGPNR